MRLIVGICGASGVNYAIGLLNALKAAKVETFLVASDWAEKLVVEETSCTVASIKKLASHVFSNHDMTAPIASSSFLVDGMIVIPASIKTISEIATAECSTLISRAADNMLKTKKKLVVCVRETPLSPPALRNMYDLSVYGVIVFPLSPAFYYKPKTIKDLESFITGKIMDLFGIKNEKFRRWGK